MHILYSVWPADLHLLFRTNRLSPKPFGLATALTEAYGIRRSWKYKKTTLNTTLNLHTCAREDEVPD